MPAGQQLATGASLPLSVGGPAEPSPFLYLVVVQGLGAVPCAEQSRAGEPREWAPVLQSPCWLESGSLTPQFRETSPSLCAPDLRRLWTLIFTCHSLSAFRKIGPLRIRRFHVTISLSGFLQQSEGETTLLCVFQRGPSVGTK